uniref:Uncharacterized protein n=1 Tax=Oryza sativa subsp. japonica TaxID=39947 RepID=Q6K2B8_ORYSJ|nr:hypothetical protein [Oryza sativa Japonica Group]BAD23698.1 hypothetical protein [Oryza sativa Japonica Group]
MAGLRKRIGVDHAEHQYVLLQKDMMSALHDAYKGVKGIQQTEENDMIDIRDPSLKKKEKIDAPTLSKECLKDMELPVVVKENRKKQVGYEEGERPNCSILFPSTTTIIPCENLAYKERKQYEEQENMVSTSFVVLPQNQVQGCSWHGKNGNNVESVY